MDRVRERERREREARETKGEAGWERCGWIASGLRERQRGEGGSERGKWWLCFKEQETK